MNFPCEAAEFNGSQCAKPCGRCSTIGKSRDSNAETKKKILALIAKWTPLAAWGVKLSLSYTRGGFLRIKHTKPIVGTSRSFIEGLLAGSGLCPSYYPDGGACDCWEPSIHWEGPDE